MDRHLARWRGKAPFDERVEAIVTRMQFLVKRFAQAKETALAELGIRDFEFETLHHLVARGDPWRATPSELAAELVVSPAGMTGRLDTLERNDLVRRIRGTQDRRRVDVELTDKGLAAWTSAMHLRAVAEKTIVGTLSPADQDTLSALLNQMLAHTESTL
ncbi:MarR family transcriptional regulator [Streptosporangium sp. KLBMP 9127]|nr:MarR family transcriptional regulator [Streptosporangium sp. KLBMP 9127]